MILGCHCEDERSEDVAILLHTEVTDISKPESKGKIATGFALAMTAEKHNQ